MSRRTGAILALLRIGNAYAVYTSRHRDAVYAYKLPIKPNWAKKKANYKILKLWQV